MIIDPAKIANNFNIISGILSAAVDHVITMKQETMFMFSFTRDEVFSIIGVLVLKK